MGPHPTKALAAAARTKKKHSKRLLSGLAQAGSLDLPSLFSAEGRRKQLNAKDTHESPLIVTNLF